MANPPADNCVACGLTIEDTGGERLVYKPDASFLTAEVKQSERDAWDSGQQPWVCQRCSKRSICPHCGEPMWPCAGADVLDAAGNKLHIPIMAGQARRCVNPNCPKS